MMRTEQQLWKSLDREAGKIAPVGAHCERFTRIESSTSLGISDVEYVTRDWHGWVELKVTLAVREDSPVTLRSEFTPEQWTWLAQHHRPENGLRSWLLIGLGGATRWRGFLLAAPMSAIPFLSSSEAPSRKAILRRPGVYWAGTSAEALARIRA